jgi:hypothetical protein
MATPSTGRSQPQPLGVLLPGSSTELFLPREPVMNPTSSS